MNARRSLLRRRLWRGISSVIARLWPEDPSVSEDQSDEDDIDEEETESSEGTESDFIIETEESEFVPTSPFDGGTDESVEEEREEVSLSWPYERR